MFGGKNKSGGKATGKSAAPEAVERAPLRPVPTTPSIIAPGTLILGGIRTGGDIQIDGRIEGDLFAASATLGMECELVGDLFAERAHIRGRVNGNVYAHHVTLANGAHISGDLSCKTFEVETGARLEGNCRHPENPLAAAATRQAANTGSHGGTRVAPNDTTFAAARMPNIASVAPIHTNGSGLAVAR